MQSLFSDNIVCYFPTAFIKVSQQCVYVIASTLLVFVSTIYLSQFAVPHILCILHFSQTLIR